MAEPTAFYVDAGLRRVRRRDAGRPARALRRRAAGEGGSRRTSTSSGLLNSRWGQTTVTESSTHPELVGASIGDIAAKADTSPFDVLCDLAVEDRMRTRVRTTFANDDVDGVTRLLQGDGCILGLSDAGAHVSQICDAVMPTDFLAHWVRDRGVMSVEHGVRKLTGEIAGVLGAGPRGTSRSVRPPTWS